MYQKYLFKNCSISTEFHKDRRLINNDASSTDDISSPTFLKLQCQYRWQYYNKVSISYYHYFFVSVSIMPIILEITICLH